MSVSEPAFHHFVLAWPIRRWFLQIRNRTSLLDLPADFKLYGEFSNCLCGPRWRNSLTNRATHFLAVTRRSLGLAARDRIPTHRCTVSRFHGCHCDPFPPVHNKFSEQMIVSSRFLRVGSTSFLRNDDLSFQAQQDYAVPLGRCSLFRRD